MATAAMQQTLPGLPDGEEMSYCGICGMETLHIKDRHNIMKCEKCANRDPEEQQKLLAHKHAGDVRLAHQVCELGRHLSE